VLLVHGQTDYLTAELRKAGVIQTLKNETRVLVPNHLRGTVDRGDLVDLDCLVLRGIRSFQPSVVKHVERSLVTIHGDPPGSRTRAAAVPVLPSDLFTHSRISSYRSFVVGVLNWLDQ